MREIKFKWFGGMDGDTFDRMHDVIGIHWGAGLVELSEDEGSTYAIENGILVQFTGLKDSQGVEIYEGDILSCGDMEHDAVIFRDGRFCRDISGQDVDYFLTESQVIGNIHDNPELME